MQAPAPGAHVLIRDEDDGASGIPGTTSPFEVFAAVASRIGVSVLATKMRHL